jgi:hypothetical protein
MINDELIHWLLDSPVPSIRFFVLKDLLSLAQNGKYTREAKRAIARAGPAPGILAGQSPAGVWRGERSYYTPKYVSTHWSMLLLAELGLDRSHPGFRRGAAHMLAAIEPELAERRESGDCRNACFWGNVLRYVAQAGYAEDPRAKILIRQVVTCLEGDAVCRHTDGQPCAWGVARGLWGLAAVRGAVRVPGIRRAIQQGAEYLLDEHQLERANYGGRTNSLWFGLNFPLFYQADILFTLRVLGELGILRRPGAQSALDLLESQRKKDGRWRGVSPYRSRTWKNFSGSEDSSRWVTLFSLEILQRAGRLSV